MVYLNKIVNFIGKTHLFFILSIISALIYIVNYYVYIIFSIILIFLFFKKYTNIIIVAFFLAVALLSPHFFIATDITEYDDIYSVKTGSGRIHIDKNIVINSGNVIIGKFSLKSKKMFFKPTYNADKIYGVYDFPFITDLLTLRKTLSNDLFYNSGGNVAMAQALIFGDKSFLTNKEKDEYTISGLAHLLAMSGMHVAIIVAIFMTALFFIHTKFRTLIAIPALMALMIFGAFSITVMRASIFAIILLIATFLDIRTNKHKFLLFLASFFILLMPNSITDISFLLSFGAVSGIVYLMDNGYGYAKTAVIMGVASTLITAPLSMYAFGTTNHLSIISTMFMSPIIYLHILFAILACIFPSLMIAPLIVIEKLSEKMVTIIYDLTFFGFINKTIPLWLLILCILFVAVTLLSKYKWLSVFALLIIFYPAENPPDIIFPKLHGSNKGFIIFHKDRKEVFFQGNINYFRYQFVPLVSKYGIKTFDYGKIRIFGGENLYFKIKEVGTNFTNICINDVTHNCSILYHTRSNSIRQKDLNDDKLHIIHKSKIIGENILVLNDIGTVIIKDEKVSYDNENHN